MYPRVMRTSINQTGSVVLPSTLVPTLLADAASLLMDSTTGTVQYAMASYQQAMPLLVRWYEAGQLEGREPRPSLPRVGHPRVTAVLCPARSPPPPRKP